MKSEDTEPNAEEVEKIEDISEQNEVISSSDGTWKYQWDLPCLASNTEEESQMTKQRKQKKGAKKDVDKIQQSQQDLMTKLHAENIANTNNLEDNSTNQQNNLMPKTTCREHSKHK
jgi:hypothetical protein